MGYSPLENQGLIFISLLLCLRGAIMSHTSAYSLPTFQWDLFKALEMLTAQAFSALHLSFFQPRWFEILGHPK